LTHQEGTAVGAVFAFLAAYLASAVELVEAFTIVLAVAVVRGWRGPIRGVLAGLAVLAAAVAVLGPALRRVPIDDLRIVVGTAITIFGIHWLRKAILRASGYKALRDERAVFERVQASAKDEETSGAQFDWYAFTIAFKAVVLEGFEVVLIVVSFGGARGHLDVAVIAAIAATITVLSIGAIVRAPLTRVPENTIKFGVGVLLTSVGTFWAAEGLGVQWPGSEAALLVIAAVVTGISLLLVARLRVRRELATEQIPGG
jgi:uncharacterized membrane protein